MNLKFRLSYGRKIKKVLRKILLIRSPYFKKVFTNKGKANFLTKKACRVIEIFVDGWLAVKVSQMLVASRTPELYHDN